jgi:hypothetical protein
MVVAPKLKELNPLCTVNTVGILDEAIVLSHSAVVITQVLPLEQLLKLNELCRYNNISFFYTFTGGVTVDVFVDHGAKHVVNDFNGERPIQKLITDIVPLSESETLIRYDTPEGQQPVALSSGYYEVSEVEGVEAMNGGVFAVSRDYKDPVKTVRVPYAFPAALKYRSGGLLTEKKVPTTYPMESLAHKLKNPGDTYGNPPTLVLTDLINFGSELQQHVAFYAVHVFHAEQGRLPTANSTEDAATVLAIAKRLVADGSVALDSFEIDEKFITRYVVLSVFFTQRFLTMCILLNRPLQVRTARRGGAAGDGGLYRRSAGPGGREVHRQVHAHPGLYALLRLRGAPRRRRPSQRRADRAPELALRRARRGVRLTLRGEAGQPQVLHGRLRRVGLRVHEELCAQRHVLRTRGQARGDRRGPH